MNDKDIIKALEHCTASGVSCKGCPAYGEDGKAKCKKYFSGAIDIIKRQQAEIERLTTLAELGQMRANDYRAMRDKAKTARAEAIKEFSERLKLESDYTCGSICKAIYVDEIDNILKEMVGD